MTFDASRFSYGDAVPEDAFIAQVPAGVASRAELFSALETALNLPEYFGRNWDALEECLRDLSWLDTRTVVVQHVDLPGLSDEELTVYLEVLAAAVDDWAPGEEHELRVLFRPDSEAMIRRLRAESTS